MKRSIGFLILAVVLLVGCTVPQGQTIAGSDVTPQIKGCKERGGEPVVVGGGSHTNVTVICFAPGVLR